MSLICVIDLETSGLDPRECGVLEMGAVMLGADLLPVGEWSRETRFESWQRWEESAARVHGVSRQEAGAVNRDPAEAALADFFGWLNGHSRGERGVLAGMNLAGFDVQFLKAIMEGASSPSLRVMMECTWKQLISHRTIDIHGLAAGIVLAKGGDISRLFTDSIYTMLEMEAEPKPHRALPGARMEAEALRRLVAMLSREVAP